MDWLFRRHFWVVHVVGVVLCAILSAWTINVLIGYALSKAFVVEPVSVAPARSVETSKKTRNFLIADERNLFGAKRESVSPVDDAASGQIISGRWEDAVATGLRVKLVGTAVFRDPRYSLAAIEDLRQSGESARSYSINECPPKPTSIDPLIVSIMGPSVLAPLVPCNRLVDVAVIKRIEEGRVYIFNEQERRYEYLSMEGVAPPVPPPMLMPSSLPSSPRSYGKSVRKVGPNSYEIDASDLDSALGNLAEISTQARMVPAFEDGKSIGFKLFNVKPDSIFEKIGLKDGDIITHLNGYEMNDPAKLMEFYTKLKSSTAPVSLGVKQGGTAPTTLQYTIVGGQ